MRPAQPFGGVVLAQDTHRDIEKRAREASRSRQACEQSECPLSYLVRVAMVFRRSNNQLINSHEMFEFLLASKQWNFRKVLWVGLAEVCAYQY